MAISLAMNPGAVAPNIFDTSSLTALRRQVKANDPAALKQAAQQFEALFLQMVLKSMRDATPQDGLFDSDQTRVYQSLLDQQLSQVMSTRGGSGLAAMIEKQLSRGTAPPEDFPDGLPLLPRAAGLPLAGMAGAPSFPAAGAGTGEPRDFVARIWPAAAEAGRATGIPPQFLVAHAALETGWGRSEPRTADGKPSYNLFGVKAGNSWPGATAEASTVEYVNGAPQRQVERFRAYGSYAEAFRDYAQLLSSPRYAAVRGAQDGASFARGLQQAGYATDPMYAAKLERIISGASLRQALIG